MEAWFSEDVPARFESYGWRVIRNVDGHDGEEVREALETARSGDGRPTLVCTKTVIGFGSPNKAGTAGVHGAALGEEEIALARRELNWGDEPFVIPEHIYADWDCTAAGAAAPERLVDQIRSIPGGAPGTGGGVRTTDGG